VSHVVCVRAPWSTTPIELMIEIKKNNLEIY
jgi:hypothetical protein